MDIEKARRKELSLALGEHFECFEEVSLQHAMFPKHVVRADIIAVPYDERMNGFALAFEVKEPDQMWHYAKWSQAIRQASDYVYAKILDTSSASKYAGSRISGAFLFPSPPYQTEPKEPTNSPFMRFNQEELLAGAFHLALHFRVGRAFWNTLGNKAKFELAFGPNSVWRQDQGFKTQGLNLLKGKRPIGSHRIDYRSELDGYNK